MYWWLFGCIHGPGVTYMCRLPRALKVGLHVAESGLWGSLHLALPSPSSVMRFSCSLPAAPEFLTVLAPSLEK